MDVKKNFGTTSNAQAQRPEQTGGENKSFFEKKSKLRKPSYGKMPGNEKIETEKVISERSTKSVSTIDSENRKMPIGQPSSAGTLKKEIDGLSESMKLFERKVSLKINQFQRLKSATEETKIIAKKLNEEIEKKSTELENLSKKTLDSQERLCALNEEIAKKSAVLKAMGTTTGDMVATSPAITVNSENGGNGVAIQIVPLPIASITKRPNENKYEMEKIDVDLQIPKRTKRQNICNECPLF